MAGPWEDYQSDPVQRELDKSKGLKRPKAVPYKEDTPEEAALATQDYAQSQRDEPYSYTKPGETLGYSGQTSQPEGSAPWEDYKAKPNDGKPKSDLLGGINKTYQEYRPSWENVGKAEVPTDPLAIPGYAMMEAGKAGANILGEIAAPLQTARDYTFGAMTGKPGEPVNPKQVGDIFQSPGGPSTDWRKNVIPGTVEGLAEMAVPMPGRGYMSSAPKPNTLIPPVLVPRHEVRGVEDPILGTKQAIPQQIETLEQRHATKQPVPTGTPEQQMALDLGIDARDIPQPEPVVGAQPTKETAGMWKKWWNTEKKKWGQELPVLRTTPNSPVITSVEQHHVWSETQLEQLTQEPWAQAILHKYKGEQWKTFEDQAVKAWKDGGKSERAYQEAIAPLPQEFKDMLARRDLQYAIENEIRTRRGLDPIPMTHEPYFPRITTEDFKHFRQVYGGGGGAGARTTVGAHQQTRYYETTREGEAAGVEYKDPRAGWLSREMNGLNLQATDQMITGLQEAGVLHSTKSAAQAASPTGQVVRISGIPFGPDKGGWWVRTAEEGEFLRQNLSFAKGNEFTRLANTYLRNPSLVNPFPHLLKNMMTKYGLTTFTSKGQMRHLVPDVLEWKNKANPQLLSRFEQVMPFTASGKNAFEIAQAELPLSPMGQAADIASKVTVVPFVLKKMQAESQRLIFSQWDPALRYAKWKEYTRQGMSDQEAANHTWIDLIRYGTRSDRIDAWKALPMNFFVPWRVGAIRTLKKSFDSNAMRTAAFVGVVDTLREIDYRNTGRWMHMPQDYLERPLMELMHGKGMGAAKTLLATAVAGPGGEYFIRSIETIMRDAQLKGNTRDLTNLFWGLSQIYDLGPEFQKWKASGFSDPMPAINMLGLALGGRHATPYGAPPRFGELIPEATIPKTGEVLGSERKGRIARGEEAKPGGMPKGLGGGMMK